MSYGIIREIYKKSGNKRTFDNITLGTVIDTNDPQQMGRVRVHCPAWDSDKLELENTPWAMFSTPFGGILPIGTRGPDTSTASETQGNIAYGMWNIPKVGATVAVMCINGNPQYRIWLGCVYDQYLNHTMPHGRFLGDGNDVTRGPLSSMEHEIQPLSRNYTKAFSSHLYEWQTRIADYSVAAIDETDVANRRVESAEKDNREGYGLSRIRPSLQFPNSTLKNFDSHVYSWTTPGFHSISMDDRPENCRMRFRTTGGHQIILDDTNERIYVMTSEGESWFEMDQKGNVDVYTNARYSVHASKDINFTSDGTIRLHGKTGIHLSTINSNIRFHAPNSEIHLLTDTTFFQTKTASWITDTFDTKANSTLSLQSGSTMHVKSGTDVNVSGSSNINIKAGNRVMVTGSQIHLNGPSATTANSATVTPPKLAYWTNRVPDHEPWSRVVIKNPSTNLDHIPEFQSSDENVNKVEEGKSLGRNSNWRR